MIWHLAKITSGRSRKTLACGLQIFVLFSTGMDRLDAAPPGPTLQLDYGRGQPLENSTVKFMYFVPLISPEPVSVFTNAGFTHCTRVTSSACHICGRSFQATCEFEFGGEGAVRNVLDHTDLVHKHEQELMKGAVLRKQLGSIDVEGRGSGKVEIAGTVTNGVRWVNEVRLLFNNHGNPSPVSICLQDISYHHGAVQTGNAIIAKVNSLVFKRTTGQPTMQISVASVKAKDASDSLWQNLLGEVKGMIANEMLPPIAVDATGHRAMLDFGLALANEDPTFTFPFANRLKRGR